jgi:RNA polymerase-interacting CarD/CdnL/TRCF family regulator
LDQKITLWNIFYEIRADLGKANTISGVSRYLCELAKLEKLIQLYKTVTATSSLQEAGDVIVGKLEKIKKGSSSERSYGYSDTVKSGVIVNNSILLDTLTTFEKQKQSINDKLLELNITTKISLSPNTQEVLTKYNLL